MKKYLLLFSLFLFGVMFNTNAQSGYEDVVYLKNGSVIRGVIIEQVINETIKIETRDGNIFVYKVGEIQKLAKEQSAFRGNQKMSRQTAFGQSEYAQNGYFGMIEAGWGLGIGNWAANRLNFNFVNGYKVVPQFSVGIGVGFRSYSYYVIGNNYDGYSDRDFTMPLFAHLRTDIIDGKVTPFIAFNIGYNLSLSGGFFGGLLMEPTVGIGFKLTRKNQLNIGVGYAIDRVQYYYDDGYYGDYGKDMGGAINFKVGIMF